MFVNLVVNIFLPKEVDKFLWKSAPLSEVLDEEPETLEKYQYFVRNLIND